MIKFVHITDCHLGNSTDTIFKDINTFAYLNKVCQAIQHNEQGLDFILVTGDISQTGEESSYEIFQQQMSQFIAPVYCLPGNHDNPELLQKYFPNSPIDTLSHLQINGAFLLLINTVVPGEEYGHIPVYFIQELEDFFDQNPLIPAIVAMHHPVIPTDTPWMDQIGVQDAKTFYEYFIKRKNIRLVLNGHVHMDIEHQQQDTAFFSTPATCYQFKKQANNTEYDTLNPGYRLIEIQNDFEIISTLKRIDI